MEPLDDPEAASKAVMFLNTWVWQLVRAAQMTTHRLLGNAARHNVHADRVERDRARRVDEAVVLDSLAFSPEYLTIEVYKLAWT